MVKIVFLDIDGVLNDALTIQRLMDDAPTMDHLECLKAIIDRTGAQIVLSSTWRLFPLSRNIIKNKLKKVGLEFIDRTKELMRGRAAEIREWLSRHSEVETFVVLDDDKTLLKEFPNNMVKTAFFSGLLPEHIDKAVEILNGNVIEI